MHPVLVLGGAGFIGSHIVKRFHESGHNVTVIDGLLDKTGGRRENLKPIMPYIKFVNSKVEDVKDLDEMINSNDIIVDCMGWTRHLSALENPAYDRQLNVDSHLCLLEGLKKYPEKRVVYMGSRGQYGNAKTVRITEDTEMVPQDIQGIHKVAGESYFRVYSQLYKLNVISLRFPNCFGENQLFNGMDIGLVGGFIRDILKGRVINVFQNDRKRNLVYAKNLSGVILELSKKSFAGFEAFNFAGYEILIKDLAQILIDIIGKGDYKIKKIPKKISFLDIGYAKFDDAKLKRLLGNIPKTGLKAALTSTVKYYKENMDDFKMRFAPAIQDV